MARVRIALLTVRTPSECCWMSKVSKAVFKTVSVLCLCSVSTCLDKNSTSSLKLPAPEWLRTELKKLSIANPRTSQDRHYVQPGLVNKVYFLLRSVRAPYVLSFQLRQLCSEKDTIFKCSIKKEDNVPLGNGCCWFFQTEQEKENGNELS